MECYFQWSVDFSSGAIRMPLMNDKTAYQQLREEIGLTQAQFAAEIGLKSHQRISQIENWQGTLKPANLIPMTKRYEKEIRKLGLTLADFLQERWW